MTASPTLARRTAAIAAATLSLSLAACGGGEDIACTMEARASVIVVVQDPSGAALDNVQVDYRIDGGTPLRAVCLGPGACVLEWEVRGQFAITVTRAGYAPASTTVQVTGDECHVQTRNVNFTLQPVAG